MKVEVVTIGKKLLMSDTLDINTPYISRSLREVNVPLTCKVTVGDDPEMILDVLQVALSRADVVLIVGSSDSETHELSQKVVAQVTGRNLVPESPGLTGAVGLGNRDARHASFLIESDGKALFYLPHNRRDMTYLMDTEVLPYIQKRKPSTERIQSVLLRTVDIMESSLKQQLSDLTLTFDHHISYDSFAGQTTIQLWATPDSPGEDGNNLEELKQAVVARLGDHIFGEGKARLEEVVLQTLKRSGRRLAVGECHTDQTLITLLSDVPGSQEIIAPPPMLSCQHMIEMLELEPPTPQLDLSQWCQTAAERLLAYTGADLSLLVYKQMRQGGVQILVTLASAHGVSVTQRSFGGHPENINQWAYTLGLAHLRRWLIVHR